MSNFMLRMVPDLLDLTAIEDGRLQLDRQPADLSRLIERDVALNRVLAAQKDIAIAIDFDSPALCLELVLDSDKIRQVLDNLLSNAIKFSHSGTRVTVRDACDGDIVTVTVQDPGQGIPAADLSKLFKPFSKTRVPTTAGEPSPGSGLAIVRRIVGGHAERSGWILRSTRGLRFVSCYRLSEARPLPAGT